MHEFLNTDSMLSAGFGAPGASTFAPRGLDLGSDWALAGAGLTIAPRETVALFASYDVQLGTRQTYHIGSGGVQLMW